MMLVLLMGNADSTGHGDGRACTVASRREGKKQDLPLSAYVTKVYLLFTVRERAQMMMQMYIIM